MMFQPPQPLNSGFFGSMMQNGVGGGMPGGSLAGSPAAFTSPPMSPSILSLLAGLQQAGTPTPVTPGSTQPGLLSAGQGPMGQNPQNPMQQLRQPLNPLTSLLNNPQLLQQLRQSLQGAFAPAAGQ